MSTDVLLLIFSVIMWGVFVYACSKDSGGNACDGSDCGKCPFPKCNREER